MGFLGMPVSGAVAEVPELPCVVLVDREDTEIVAEDVVELARLDLLVQGAAGRVVDVAPDVLVPFRGQGPGAGGGDGEAGVAGVDVALRIPGGDQQLGPGGVVGPPVHTQDREALERLDELGEGGVVGVLEHGAIGIALVENRLVEDACRGKEPHEGAGVALRQGVGPQSSLGARAEVPVGLVLGDADLVLDGLHECRLHITGVVAVARSDEEGGLVEVGPVEPLLDRADRVDAAGEEDVRVHREQRLEHLRGDPALVVRRAHVQGDLDDGFLRGGTEDAVAVASPVALAEQGVLDEVVHVRVRVPLLDRAVGGQPRKGGGAERRGERADAQLVLEAHGQGVHGAPARLPVLGAALVAGDSAVGAIDPLLGFQDFGVCHCCSRLSVMLRCVPAGWLNRCSCRDENPGRAVGPVGT